jgi:tetratricopeptide (TPR) repeat protein
MDNPSSPEKILDSAKLLYQEGDYAAATTAFKEAEKAYLQSGDALMAAEMQNNQSVALLRAKDPDAALRAVKGSESVFAKAGEFRREGMALANIASALQALKRSKEAIDYYVKAGDALQRADEGEMRAEVMQLLSMLYLKHFKFYEAILALQAGLSGLKNPTPRQRFMKKILFFHL